MIQDDVIWEIINNAQCAYKIKSETQTFCKNEYNLTGLCSKQSCPLGNSRYATIREQKGVCYLFVKTIERAHLPSQLWEKIKLNATYSTALEEIDEELAYWPKFIIHKCKQRLTKLRQMLTRMRRLKLRVREKISTIKKKTERRDKIRELKAEKVARIENQIEAELLQRKKQGVYGELYDHLEEKEEVKEPEIEIEYEAEEEKEAMEDIEDY